MNERRQQRSERFKAKGLVMETNDRVVNAQQRATVLQQETQRLKEAHASLENKLGEGRLCM